MPRSIMTSNNGTCDGVELDAIGCIAGARGFKEEWFKRSGDRLCVCMKTKGTQAKSHGASKEIHCNAEWTKVSDC